MASNPCAHIRRPDGAANSRGLFGIACDCGWSGAIGTVDGAGAALDNSQIEAALDAKFVDHIPAAERRTYILVDARSAGEGLINGNFVMPEGVPVQLLSSHKFDGVHFGDWRDPDTGETGTLPIGEVRTPESQVFRMA